VKNMEVSGVEIEGIMAKNPTPTTPSNPPDE
jgi:hypothetical protein